jgi:hypothetical protein
MSRLLIILSGSIISNVAIASTTLSCAAFANGVLSNTKDKNVKNVTIEYPVSQREMVQICRKQIEDLEPKYTVQLLQVPDNQKMQAKYNY